jgi:hypothetical protein
LLWLLLLPLAPAAAAAASADLRAVVSHLPLQAAASFSPRVKQPAEMRHASSASAPRPPHAAAAALLLVGMLVEVSWLALLLLLLPALCRQELHHSRQGFLVADVLLLLCAAGLAAGPARLQQRSAPVAAAVAPDAGDMPRVPAASHDVNVQSLVSCLLTHSTVETQTPQIAVMCAHC